MADPTPPPRHPLPPAACPNCGSADVGRYCASCGQQVPSPSDYALRSHLAEFAEEVTSTDGKLLRTGWMLVSRPGRLTMEHLAGRRRRYLKPVQIFLLVNVILFLVAPRVPFFQYSLRKYLQYAPPSPELVTRLVRQEMSEMATPGGGGSDAGRSFDAYEAAFDARLEVQRKSFVILFVPLIAAVLWLLFALAGRREGRPRRYGEHLVFAFHLLSFLWLALAGAYGIGSLWRPIDSLWIGAPLIALHLAMIAAMPLHLFLAVRNGYGLRFPAALVVSAVVGGALLLLMLLYRGLLFFTTYYTM